jgi:hypothetical protein
MNRMKIAALLLAALATTVLRCAAAQQESTDTQGPKGEAALDEYLGELRPRACAADPGLCPDLKSFAIAGRPCLPEGERLYVGHAYLIDDEGTVRPAEYLVLRSVRAQDVTLVQTQHVYSENEGEKQAAEALIRQTQEGVIDEANPLYRYIAERGGQVPQLLAEPEPRSLVVRAEGPVVYLRQFGKRVYAVLPRAVVSVPGVTQTSRGLVFAVLPAPEACH